ncbi:MAG: divalent-cation tolerance protein CutA [Candidatus Ranarchaeia archaeon]|jgi:periplasmic divalent cation tolerance protein
MKILFTTVEKKLDAQKLANILVEGEFAACVQMIPIESVYRWGGKVVESQEIILLIKTSDQKTSALVETLEKEHPYDVPEIVSIDPSQVGKKYLSWLLDVTKSES